MRRRCTMLAASGHSHFLVPIACAASDGGHTVACDPSIIPTVEAAECCRSMSHPSAYPAIVH